MSASLYDIKRPPWTNAPPADRLILRTPDPMLARAQRNYPDSEFNQAAWLRAVAMVRATRIGWRLDNPQTKGKCNV